jgi:hypothetical protein
MAEPKLLSAAELAAIRARSYKDADLTLRGWTNKCAGDRRALLAHIDALKTLELVEHADEMFCGRCGIPLTFEEARKHYCPPHE